MQRHSWKRPVLGGAGLALCIVGLAAHAKAKPVPTTPPIIVTGEAAQAPPNLFGTVALPVQAKRFADAWYRSRIDATADPRIRQLIAPARSLSPEQQVAFVQSAVHRQIRWISDATEWSVHDYWASAAETLERGAGDMEDRAIVKLQALKALGFSGRDLYLTQGRDAVGGPITVLLVRLGGRILVLDDTGGKPVLAERREGFEPVLSFGSSQAWVHGKRVARSSGNAGASK